MRNKIWAFVKADENWYQRASGMSQEMRDQYRSKSIRDMATDHLNYIRMRAFLGVRENESGWPWDRPANLLWKKLNGEKL